jgi:competence protein ComEC
LSEDFEGRQSAFLKALFLGERSDLDQDFKDLFLKTGTMHILAVSGFNIGFVCSVLWLFLKPVPISRNAKLGLLLSASWAYCLLVGWQAPVVRATLMASVFLVGQMIGRKGDGLNALGLAACVILALNPKELFDVGFQLSFLAVFGLVTLSPTFLKSCFGSRSSAIS